MSLNAVAHSLVCAARREKNETFTAAAVASFLSSQQHCGVLLNVIYRKECPRWKAAGSSTREKDLPSRNDDVFVL